MKSMKLLLGVALLLALSGPVWATPTTIPFEQAYSGPTYWHISDWDDGSVYTGKLLDGVTAAPLDTPISASLLEKIPTAGPQGVGDAWGIVSVDTINAATLSGPNNMSIDITKLLFKQGDAGVEVYGVFYGRKDDTVTFRSNGSQEIYSDPLGYVGERIDLYVQPLGTAAAWSTGMGGPAAATTAGFYPGIGTDATGNLLPGATLVLTGYVQPGFENGGLDGVSSTFKPNGNSGTGTFDFYITWDGGTDLNTFGSPTGPGVFPFDGGPGAPYDADAYLSGTDRITTSPASNPWLVSTSDPAYMNAVPEPVTMMSMVLGIGYLGRYIRRRK